MTATETTDRIRWVTRKAGSVQVRVAVEHFEGTDDPRSFTAVLQCGHRQRYNAPPHLNYLPYTVYCHECSDRLAKEMEHA